MTVSCVPEVIRNLILPFIGYGGITIIFRVFRSPRRLSDILLSLPRVEVGRTFFGSLIISRLHEDGRRRKCKIHNNNNTII